MSTPIIADMPMAEPFGAKKMYVLLRFAKWNEALDAADARRQGTVLTDPLSLRTRRRPCRARRRGRCRTRPRRVSSSKTARSGDAMIGYNPAAAVFLACDAVLEARIAAASNNLDSAIRGVGKGGRRGGRSQLR